jgi:hypothetical protein
MLDECVECLLLATNALNEKIAQIEDEEEALLFHNTRDTDPDEVLSMGSKHPHHLKTDPTSRVGTFIQPRGSGGNKHH